MKTFVILLIVLASLPLAQAVILFPCPEYCGTDGYGYSYCTTTCIPGCTDFSGRGSCGGGGGTTYPWCGDGICNGGENGDTASPYYCSDCPPPASSCCIPDDAAVDYCSDTSAPCCSAGNDKVLGYCCPPGSSYDTTAGSCIVQNCGNSVIEGSEQCDKLNLNGNTCATFGFASGTLTCDPTTCTFDTSTCSSPPPAGPAVTCPVGTVWNPATFLCEPVQCGSPSLPGNGVGMDCSVLTAPALGGYYCSNANIGRVEQTPGNTNDGHCCAAGDYWDPSLNFGLGACNPTAQCNQIVCTQASPVFPNPAPITPAFNTRSGASYNARCAGTAASDENPGPLQSGACCMVPTRFGQNNVYYYADESGSSANNFQIY